MFHLASLSESFPLMIDVPAVRAKNRGLIMWNVSCMNLTNYRSFASKVHCRHERPVPNAVESI